MPRADALRVNLRRLRSRGSPRCSAFVWMNSRRGSTSSPISLVKMSSASADVVDPHLQQRPRLRVERRLPELLGVHLAQALVALQRQPLLALARSPRRGARSARRSAARGPCAPASPARRRPPAAPSVSAASRRASAERSAKPSSIAHLLDAAQHAATAAGRASWVGRPCQPRSYSAAIRSSRAATRSAVPCRSASSAPGDQRPGDRRLLEDRPRVVRRERRQRRAAPRAPPPPRARGRRRRSPRPSRAAASRPRSPARSGSRRAPAWSLR